MVAVILLALAVVQPLPHVGEVRFPNSGAPAAQEAFLIGVAQLHNFEYADAAAWFRKAQDADPDFALAYWGEAMTYNHPVWMEQDISAARRALKRLGDTADARARKARTAREQAYLHAVEILYGDGDKFSRDDAYAEAMAALHGTYPDDVDATAFYALALLGTAHDGRDFATYMRAAALLEPLFPTHPNHPGIAHYLIHSYDDPIHAPLGLRAARAYSKIAPAAGHAQHMCSHIFVAMGMWDDVVEANETAVQLTAGAILVRPLLPCSHYPEWLAYGYLQQGRYADAKRMVLACGDAARKVGSFEAFAGMRARYLIDSGDWDGEIAHLRVPPDQPGAAATAAFTDALGAVARRDPAAARAARAEFEAARTRIEDDVNRSRDNRTEGTPASTVLGRLTILAGELAGALETGAGGASSSEGLALLRKAAADEEKLPYEFGPPFVDKPAYELLGEALLASKQPAEAKKAFERAIARTPGRSGALVGLIAASEESGDAKRAASAREELKRILRRADRLPAVLQ